MISSNNNRMRVLAEFTHNLASLSKCKKRKVAAIALNDDATQVYSIGLNGGPKGGADCLCSPDGKYGCIHAEAQCIAKCTTTDMHKVMICTLSPCVTCASLIVNTGFEAVYYIEQWKDTSGLDVLKEAGIIVSKITLPSKDDEDYFYLTEATGKLLADLMHYGECHLNLSDDIDEVYLEYVRLANYLSTYHVPFKKVFDQSSYETVIKVERKDYVCKSI